MADSKLTALTAETAPVGADLIYLVDDVAGTPTSKKATVTDLAASAPFVALYAPVAGEPGGPPIVIRKPSNESVTSNQTLQDDDHLTFAIGASEEWAWSANLVVTGPTAGDIQVAVTFPSGATSLVSFKGRWTNETSLQFLSESTSGTAVTFGAHPTSKWPIQLDGTILNGATPGSVTIQWAQAVSTGSATSVLAGSDLVAHRIA